MHVSCHDCGQYDEEVVPNPGDLREEEMYPKTKSSSHHKKQITASRAIIQSGAVTFSLLLSHVWLEKWMGKVGLFILDSDPDGVNCCEDAYAQQIM